MTELALRFYSSFDSAFALDIEISLPGSGITGIYGPSAAGKTTLLRCIAGLHRAEQGYCRVNGQCWQDENHFTPVHQRQLGYVFQQANLFSHLNVEQNLRYGLSRLPAKERHITYRDAVDWLGLAALQQHPVTALSGGQRQRVAIARALLASPRLLLMDEPMASLDTASKREILPYLEQLHDQLQIPVLYVSHSLDELLPIADHLLLMNNGELQASGPLNTLLTRDDLPLAQLDEASVVIDGTVQSHLDEDHLSALQTTAGTFYIGRLQAEPGQAVRLRIAARDVSITLSPANDTSISHILPAKIDAIWPGSDPSRALLRLRVGQELLLASITQRSVHKLQLQAGKPVYAQVKSVALT